jgi:hypothetical protein
VKALRLYAGPKALAHIQKNGLHPGDVGVIPAAAGGPKGLVLGPLDKFIFGHWLAQSQQPVHLVGASIGAWRMATACLHHPQAAFDAFADAYVGQHYELQPGESRVPSDRVSAEFRSGLEAFFGDRQAQLLQHPRYRLHVLANRGRGLLRRDGPWRTPAGFAGLALSNLTGRQNMGLWMERVVFSVADPAQAGACATLPFDPSDFPTRQVAMTPDNVLDVLQASCSIPLVLKPVQDIAGAPPGAYWDGGITDYHLHLNYAHRQGRNTAPLVLYPHFQRAVVPGWLDKSLRWRHRSTAFLDSMLLLCPDPGWVNTLPRKKLPDRSDFSHFGNDLAGRTAQWRVTVNASAQLAEEFEACLALLARGHLPQIDVL